MPKPKFDYDSDEFYDEILALSMQGYTDAEIADGLEDKFGVSLSAPVFSTMVNGKYEAWSEEENQRRGERLSKVLARGRRKINAVVRGRFLKAALGGIKVKSQNVVKRKLRIGGEYTEDEEIQTSEGFAETAPNIQALSTWLYHHDPEWRKVERKLDEDASDVPTETERGVDIDSWIKLEAGVEEKE